MPVMTTLDLDLYFRYNILSYSAGHLGIDLNLIEHEFGILYSHSNVLLPFKVINVELYLNIVKKITCICRHAIFGIPLLCQGDRWYDH